MKRILILYWQNSKWFYFIGCKDKRKWLWSSSRTKIKALNLYSKLDHRSMAGSTLCLRKIQVTKSKAYSLALAKHKSQVCPHWWKRQCSLKNCGNCNKESICFSISWTVKPQKGQFTVSGKHNLILKSAKIRIGSI